MHPARQRSIGIETKEPLMHGNNPKHTGKHKNHGGHQWDSTPGALKAPRCNIQINATIASTSLSPSDQSKHTNPELYATDLALTTTRGAHTTLMDGNYLAAAGRE